MKQTLLNRLAALEAARPVEQKPPSPWPAIMHQLIAFHLGGYKADGHRSPAEAYAAATGWTTPERPQLMDMTRALHDGDPLYGERHKAALQRMFASRGVDIEGDGDAFALVLADLMSEARAGGMSLPEVPEREAA
jgi:hypothetical protein